MFVWYEVGDSIGICVVDTGVEVKIRGLFPRRVVGAPVAIGARLVGYIHTNVVGTGLWVLIGGLV